jgi:branched-chain amino acid transport system ATP-binding protein
MSALLSVNSLHKSFGGVAATDGVDLEIFRGEVLALIGPNGAGKTTLVSQLSGLLRPDSGSIYFKTQDVTGWPMHRLARQGLARSFQITSVFSDMSVLENTVLAVQASRGHSLKFWTPVRALGLLHDKAEHVLAQVGLLDQAHRTASELSHGERRQLELAMALCTDPELLLLDEPMAGMSVQESRDMMALLRSFKGELTVLLVEHDMEAVFALADRVAVLVYGKLLRVGTPEEIRSDADVRAAYLGDDSA